MRLAKTCPANPEQYDVFHGKQKIGYLRLRYGRFTVDFLPNGKHDDDAIELWQANTIGDGEFDASEREKFLSVAKTLLRKAFEMKE